MPDVEAGSETQVSSLVKINIVEQIEYYFGDFNMMRDKFLKAEVQKDDGWVPISVLLRFNRLAAITKDSNIIISAFKENPSQIVQLDEENKRLRRNPDRVIPEPGEDWRNTVAQRTVYAKGFPVESTTLDDILKFLQTFGKIDNVVKRTYRDKALDEWKFKGSIFVTFPTREDAQKFLDIKSVKFAGNELIRKWQTDYNEEKKNERIQKKLSAKELKTQILKNQAESEMKPDQKLPTGALIQLTGLNGDELYGTLKKKLIEDFKWDVGFLQFTGGEKNAYVRLQGENSAKEALTKLTDNSFKINNVTVKAELVEGEKETELLEKMDADRKSRVLQNFMRSKNKGGKKNKGFRQRGKRQGSGRDGNSGKMDETNGVATKKDNLPSTSDNSDGSATDSSSLKRKPEESSPANSEAKKSKSDE